MDHLTFTGYSRRPPHLVGLKKGFFTKENLEVDFHLVGLAPQHNQEMAEGKWNMTLSSADTMIARSTSDGIDYVLFMQTEEGLSVQLIAQPEYTSLEDLRGKLLAADPVDSNFDLVRNKIMRDNGITDDQYEIEIIGNTPKRFVAFQEGRVAAAMLSAPSSEKAIAAGGVVLAEGADYIPNWPLACGWGLRSWVEGNRELVVRFIRAWASAADWLLMPENREETLEILMKEEGLSRARAEDGYARVVPKAAINPEAIRKNIEIRIELGYYPPPQKPTEAFYDASYWSEATGLAAPAPAGMPENASES